MDWSTYNYLYYSKVANAYLLYNSLSNMIVKLDAYAYDAILKIKANPNDIDEIKSEFKFLFDGRFIVQSNETEVNKQKLTSLRKRFDTNALSLTIAPTRMCNFNCPYCYENERINKKMSKTAQNDIIEFVKSHKSIESLNVIWYGGEPTLEYDTINFLSAECQKIVKNYSAFIVTNGYLLDKLIDNVEKLKISGMQITLDGTRETHNKTRCLKNGNDTFDKIINNIDSIVMRQLNIKISIRMNISKTNSDEYLNLHNFLRERYSGKVNLYPAFVCDYGTDCHNNLCYNDNVEKSTFIKNLFLEKGVYTNDLYPFRINKGCMMHQMNAYVIGPDGELYKCWHHLGVSDKIVGNITSTPIITNGGLLADLMLYNDSWNDDKCNSCVLFPSCFGGCTDNKMKNMDYCIPAKSMIEDILDIRYTINTKSSSLNTSQL